MAESQPVSQPLSLQAWPAVDKDKESLQYLISRINEQKGSFRNVTEESLEEELRHLGNGGDPDAVASGGDTNEQDITDAEEPSTKKDSVYKAREEILKHVGQAYQESATALDFISLLLSKHAPAAASLTLSPFLKSALPLGSLGAESSNPPPASDAETRDQEIVALGWRMQSLSNSADSLLKAATRLEKEIGREATFWDHILSVKQEGWSLCRMPREKHTLGVRYGFAESYADFRDRGLGALRRDEDGQLSLDRGVRAGTYWQLRVRLLRRGEAFAASRERLQDGEQGSAIARQILQARDSIFDEELHMEIHREARGLLSHDVRCNGSNVLIPFEGDKQVEVDLVDAEQVPNEPRLESHVTADSILIALRLLLSQAHRLNLKNRSQVPSPLRGEGTRPRPVYPILKPVLDVLSKGQNPIRVLSKITLND